jgi:hypothetical protein
MKEIPLKRRAGCAQSIHAADSMSLEQFQDYLGLMGWDRRQGYTEFDGFHFYWTPRGREQHETTAADFLFRVS